MINWPGVRWFHRPSLTWQICGSLSIVGMAIRDAWACPASPPMMTGMAQTAEADFSDLNSDGFNEARARMLEAASCLDSAPSPSDAIEVHRVEALAAFMAGDENATRLSLHAMLEVDATATLSLDLAPEGHRLRILLEEARELPSSNLIPSEVAPPCSLVVDGTRATTRPSNRPALVVVQGPGGRVVGSELLAAGENLMVYCEGPVLLHSRRTWPLWVATGGAAALSGGLWTATLLNAERAESIQDLIHANAPEEVIGMTPPEIDAARVRRDRLSAAAKATTGLAAGLGLLAVGVTIRW